MPCPPLDCGEPSVARLSAVGNTIYVVGVRTITRYHWDGTALRRDDSWACPYIGNSQRSHGWDAVIGDRHLWLMDNGQHRYRTSMVGRGVAQAPNRLIRVALADAEDWQGIDVSGLPGGSITNPPLWDEARQIVIAYDSANRVICGFRFEEEKRALVPLWRQDGFGCASHMVLYPGTSVHSVSPITRGQRLASFFWVQSMVREDSKRALLFELDRAIQKVAKDAPGPGATTDLAGVYHNLLRLWADA